MLNLDAIETFCAIVETGNFRQAAEQLHRTQPAVTQQLKRLEAEVGHILLDRRLRKPTQEGALLYTKGKQLLRDVREIPRMLSDELGESQGSLRVGASDTNALYFLPDYISAFMKKWPDTKLEIHSRSTDGVADDVADGKLDVGIITLPLTHPDLETHSLYHQQLKIVTSRDHSFSKRKRIRVSDLEDQSLILLNPSTRTGFRISQFFTEQGLSPTIAMYSGSFEVMKRYVREGLGVAILPQMVMDASDDDLAVHTMPELPEIGIGVIWHKRGYLSKTARAFIQLLQA